MKIIIDGEEMQTIKNPIRCTKAADGWCQKINKKTFFTKGMCEDGKIIVATSCHDRRLMCGYIYKHDQWKKEVLPILLELNRAVVSKER